MLRGAIVGFGNVAQLGHWPGYANNGEAEIVAVIDQSEKRRAAAKSLKHSLGTFHSLGELAPDAIDFVDICTPPSRHLEPMLQAIERGWHVLCEKPLLLESNAIDQARAKALEAGVAIMPVHNWKYAPIIRAATKLLGEGAIGKLRRVEITTLRLRDAPAADDSQPNWRRDPKVAGGGIVMDHGWHSIYLALHWFNEIPGQITAERTRTNEQSIESEAVLDLSFPSGETRIELSWNASERANRIALIGDKGKIALDDNTLLVNEESQRFEPGLTAGSHHADWFEAMLPDVLDAFRDPKKSRPIFEEAANCLTIIRRAYAVARAS